MAQFVGLDVSQKITAVCIVDGAGTRLWRGQCLSTPEQIEATVCQHADKDVRLGTETGPMTTWLVHELRSRGLDVVCLDARHARAALKMQLNKTDANDAEGLAQIMRTGWFRSVHVKSFETHRARALLGARAQLVGMTTRLSNHIRGVLKTFGLLPGAMRGLPFDRRVEALLERRTDVTAVVLPMLDAWRQLRVQISAFDKAVREIVKASPTCRLLMTVPGIGALTGLAYVSTVEDPDRFRQSRAVGAHCGLTPRQYQSGQIDRSGRISRCGDVLIRTMFDLGRREAKERLADLIYEMLVRYRVVEATDDDVMPWPITQDGLADATGLTPLHVNRFGWRVLHRFQTRDHRADQGRGARLCQAENPLECSAAGQHRNADDGSLHGRRHPKGSRS